MRPQIVIVIVDSVPFVAFVGLSWRLIRASQTNKCGPTNLTGMQTYGERSFARVHKRPEMSRLYIVSPVGYESRVRPH
jgi:hypothetical protein